MYQCTLVCFELARFARTPPDYELVRCLRLLKQSFITSIPHPPSPQSSVLCLISHPGHIDEHAANSGDCSTPDKGLHGWTNQSKAKRHWNYVVESEVANFVL